MKQQWKDLFLNHRQLAVLMTSLASGLPLLLSGSTLQAWFSSANVSLLTIGSITFLGLPYVLKFLWAPLLDCFYPNNSCRRRFWLMLTQGLMGCVLLAMSLFNPETSPASLFILAAMLAVLSATQDIAVDAFRTEVIKKDERGFAAALLALGYRVAMLISGAIAFIVAATWGWPQAYRLMAAMMFVSLLYSYYLPPVLVQETTAITLKSAIVEPIKDFFTREQALWIIVFLLLYRVSDALALSMNVPFLLRGIGFTLLEVGALTKTIGMTALLLGSLIGGVAMSRLGLYRSLLYFGILQALSNLCFVWLALVGKKLVVMSVCVFLENFCAGLGTVALVCLLMSLCDTRYTATQYALLSAVVALTRIVIGPIAAVIVQSVGWLDFYIISCFLSIPALIILLHPRNQLRIIGVS